MHSSAQTTAPDDINRILHEAMADESLELPPPPQVVPAGQPPQSCIFPQPSPIIPQYWPVGCMQLMAVQAPPISRGSFSATWRSPGR